MTSVLVLPVFIKLFRDGLLKIAKYGALLHQIEDLQIDFRCQIGFGTVRIFRLVVQVDGGPVGKLSSKERVGSASNSDLAAAFDNAKEAAKISQKFPPGVIALVQTVDHA